MAISPPPFPAAQFKAVQVDVAELQQITETQGGEIDANTSAINVVSSALTNETANRIAADGTLQANINAEASARTAADLALSGDITALGASTAAALSVAPSSLFGNAGTVAAQAKSITLGTFLAFDTGSNAVNVLAGTANTLATLDGSGYLSAAQIPPALSSGFDPKGVWNAATNTPTLTSGVGTNGDIWAVGQAGTTTLNGISSWNISDQALFSGGVWQKIPMSSVYGSMAVQNATGVSISGGAVTTTVVLGDPSGSTWTLSPLISAFAEYVVDGEGNVAGGTALDGTLRYAAAYFDRAVIDQITNDFSDAGGVERGAISPLYNGTGSLLTADQFGNVSEKIEDDGTHVFGKIDVLRAVIHDLVLEELSLAALAVGVSLLDDMPPVVEGLSYAITDESGNAALTITDDGITEARTSRGRLSELITLPNAQQIAKPGFFQTAQFSNGYCTARTSAQTWATLRALRGKFMAVRLVYAYDGKGVSTIEGALVAATSVPNNGIQPLNAAGGPQAWTRVTFNNGGNPVSYWDQLQAVPPPSPIFSRVLVPAPAGATNHTPPFGGGDGVGYMMCGKTYSDWIPLTSIDRTDGGSFPLIMARAYITGDTRIPGACPVTSAWETASGGDIVRAFVNPGDCVSDPALFTSTALVNQLEPLAIEFLSSERAITVFYVGDSTMQGVGTTESAWNYVYQTCQTLRNLTSFFLQPMNGGNTGMSCLDYLWNAENVIGALQPDIVVIQVGSINAVDGTGNFSNLTSCMDYWRRCLVLAQRVKEYGGVVIFITPWPSVTCSYAGDQNRLAIIARVNASRDSQTFVVDCDPIIGIPPANPGTDTWAINPAYTGDGTHMNNAGNGVLSQQGTLPILARLIGVS
ncbi:MAG: hypothetical protein WDN25_13490 [Acetobacteraceae bacterium]